MNKPNYRGSPIVEQKVCTEVACSQEAKIAIQLVRARGINPHKKNENILFATEFFSQPW